MSSEKHVQGFEENGTKSRIATPKEQENFSISCYFVG